MCGRYCYWDSQTINEHYHSDSDFSIEANYNVSPQSSIPVLSTSLKKESTDLDHPQGILSNRFSRHLDLMRWGLVPDWAKEGEHRGFINARSESVSEKKSFKESFLLRRCLVPARGFYEWDEKKQPYFISPKSQHLALAAIWDGGNAGIVPSVAILTRASHKLSYIHERVPVCLTEEQIDIWLDPMSSKESLMSIIENSNDLFLDAHKVDKRVSHPKENDIGLLAELRELPF